MNKTESERLANSQTLSQLAMGLILAAGAFLAFALDKRTLSEPFWILIGIGIGLLVLSMIFGGRGVARISSPDGLFNLQAWACLIGFLFLTSSLLAMGKPVQDDTTTNLSRLSKEIGSIDSRLQMLESNAHINIQTASQNSSQISSLQNELDKITEGMAKLDESISSIQKYVPKEINAQQAPPAYARPSRR